MLGRLCVQYISFTKWQRTGWLVASTEVSFSSAQLLPLTFFCQSRSSLVCRLVHPLPRHFSFICLFSIRHLRNQRKVVRFFFYLRNGLHSGTRNEKWKNLIYFKILQMFGFLRDSYGHTFRFLI